MLIISTCDNGVLVPSLFQSICKITTIYYRKRNHRRQMIVFQISISGIHERRRRGFSSDEIVWRGRERKRERRERGCTKCTATLTRTRAFTDSRRDKSSVAPFGFVSLSSTRKRNKPLGDVAYFKTGQLVDPARQAFALRWKISRRTREYRARYVKSGPRCRRKIAN